MEDGIMATNSNSGGAFGMLGVLIGAAIVLLVGGFFLMSNGMLGNQNTVKLELPKISGTK
jgi:hypothetical protein